MENKGIENVIFVHKVLDNVRIKLFFFWRISSSSSNHYTVAPRR